MENAATSLFIGSSKLQIGVEPHKPAVASVATWSSAAAIPERFVERYATMPHDDRRLVYSTDGSLPLPASKSKAKAVSPANAVPANAVPDDGIVRVGCERRRGGSVTIVYGLAPAELEPLAAELKRRCGTGGTAKDGVVTLQGDRRDTILAFFAERKRRTKRMGG